MIIFISVLEVILNLGYTIFWLKYAIGEADSYYTRASFLYNGDYGVRVSYTINNVLVLFTDVAIYGLIVFQTVALWIRIDMAFYKSSLYLCFTCLWYLA